MESSIEVGTMYGSICDSATPFRTSDMDDRETDDSLFSDGDTGCSSLPDTESPLELRPPINVKKFVRKSVV
jgi:hypothetical protein